MHDEDTEEVDHEVMEFVLRKPWYAGTRFDTYEGAGVGLDSATENSPRISILARSSRSHDQGQRSDHSKSDENGFPQDSSLCEGYESDMESDTSDDDTPRPQGSDSIVDVSYPRFTFVTGPKYPARRKMPYKRAMEAALKFQANMKSRLFGREGSKSIVRGRHRKADP